ncbi:MAG: UDP-N-acetylglucosamine 2-epimerase [Bacteroidota bacterium]|jgi:UDP-N-acetylglucosamine 2-epimerase
MRKLLTVIGTRPQYIKYAAMAGRLSADFHEHVVDTGQHYDDALSGQFKQEFLIGANFRTLDINGLEGSARFAAMIDQLNRIIDDVHPDGVLCFGDTDSTLAAGIASVQRGVPVFHVEAGERSRHADGSRIEGWTVPEESNRVIVDHLSSLLLCTTEDAAENCAIESCAGDAVITGDVMYDLFLTGRERVPDAAQVLRKSGIDDGPYYFCTVHRAINTDDGTRLSGLLETLNNLAHPVLLPMHPRTARRVREHEIVLAPGSLHILPPISHAETLALTIGAERVLTDSGGLTREAYFCGVPSVCLDDITAWHALCRSGWCTLTGADATAIQSAIDTPAPLRRDASIFGDGHAAENIVYALVKFFG